MKLRHKIAEWTTRPSLVRAWSIATAVVRALRESRLLFVDARVRPVPRYGYGKPPHAALYAFFDRQRSAYRERLKSFLRFQEDLWRIPMLASDPGEPCWRGGNLWIPALDAVSLYSLLRLFSPRRYVEIGSGYSTRFARRAIRDGGLATRIIAIDPHPRIAVAALCDVLIRERLEDLDPRLFDELESDDILFIDGSHRCFMNSDVTVVFLDVLPRLRRGVIVQFHDIFLPYDYPPNWGKRYYSEQYLLAVWLLARDPGIEVLLPNAFISRDPELSRVLDPLWEHPRMREVNRNGASLWIRIA
ncbi:MAG: class I SAM-dependent methyltransferase [Blastocatellia bacterium]|nr:class I SAM-dependent methyltransferase [Blastocatellia bacterium]MCS7158554.1 class I SAM-dependent methyltransferase [Blastocatellia bacterium]MDW8169321.1 class I SAM-dependent methyltransferase [Acidobacteriota bacterium]MDW8257750.1 class I SAM-dependent methyltransferase [Acidobacteriota bacterium]